MGEFFSNLSDQMQQIQFDATAFETAMGTVVPIVSWIVRFLMIAFGVVVLYRSLRSLFREKTPKEVWGTLSFPNGVQYELNHWENVLGRGGSSDVMLDFPFISRSHAALLRDDKGSWSLFPLQAKNGTKHNGEDVTGSVSIQAGDVINLGGADLHFYPLSQAEEAAQSRKKGVYKRAIKPHITLAYLTVFQLLMMIQSMMTVETEHVLKVFTCFLLLCGLSWGLYIVYRAFKRTAFEVETMAFFLCTLSFGVTSAYAPSSLLSQTAAIILGIGAFFALSLGLRDLNMAVSLRWPMAIFAGVLLTFNLLFGQRIFGAKNWMSIGPFTFQPSEFIKIAFIIAGAATLDRLFSNRNLIFTTLFAGFCVGCLALMSDFGTALIFFVAFLVITFMRSGNWGFLLMMGVAAGLGCGIILQFKPYIANRFEAWGNVWEYATTTGYQQTRTLSAIASGGLFGKSPDDVFLKRVGAANTDLVFGVVSEEFGLILAICAVIVIIGIALFAVKSAGTARSSFYTIASCTAATILAFQTCLNVFGSVDILPLTGVTFPFVSIGGSSMISCWGLLAFIKASDTRRNASFTVKRPKFRGLGKWKDDDSLPPDWEGELPDEDTWEEFEEQEAFDGPQEDLVEENPDEFWRSRDQRQFWEDYDQEEETRRWDDDWEDRT